MCDKQKTKHGVYACHLYQFLLVFVCVAAPVSFLSSLCMCECVGKREIDLYIFFI